MKRSYLVWGATFLTCASLVSGVVAFLSIKKQENTQSDQLRLEAFSLLKEQESRFLKALKDSLASLKVTKLSSWLTDFVPFALIINNLKKENNTSALLKSVQTYLEKLALHLDEDFFLKQYKFTFQLENVEDFDFAKLVVLDLDQNLSDQENLQKLKKLWDQLPDFNVKIMIQKLAKEKLERQSTFSLKALLAKILFPA